MARHCLWLTKGLGRGGAERLLVDLLPLVDSGRYEIDVAYILPWKDSFHTALEERGARVLCLEGGGLRGLWWVPNLARIVAENGYDLVHTHAPVPAVAARLLYGRRERPALVHTEHNMWGRYRPLTRWANSLTYGANRSVIAVSDSVARSIEPKPATPDLPVVTIHHGTMLDAIRPIDLDGRAKARADLGLRPDGYLIGNVGNFTPKKNHRLLLEAMARSGPIERAHLVLIGLGPLEQELQRKVAALGLTDRVVFLSSRDDVFEILPLLDVFCLSSDFEGFPIALVEAMATGLPVVATSVGGVGEVVVDGSNGLLVGAGDVDGLQAAIERFMIDHDLAAACGREAKRSSEALDLRNAAATMQDVYDRSLMERR